VRANGAGEPIAIATFTGTVGAAEGSDYYDDLVWLRVA